ncbi:hypothetical protein OBBRIDRAFT_709540, partial [Obba rivulosa]
MSDQTRKKLQHFWRHFTYLVIDEISMISRSFLAELSKNIGIGKERIGKLPNFHQFAPVVGGSADALYQPIDLARDKGNQQLGRGIYDEFTTVVILKQQVRVTDEVWRDFLTHLRYGRVQEHHLHMLRKLVITDASAEPTNFTTAPWKDAPLVTPRHSVRRQWNKSAVRKHCREIGNQLFIAPAEDTIKGQPLTLLEHYGLACRGAQVPGRRKSQARADLPDKIEMAVGMKVMVTTNVKTDLDITNGARGEIIDIVLDPREPAPSAGNIVELKYPPAFILVKMAQTRA